MKNLVNSVQDHINQKAEIRFAQDLQSAVDALRANPILSQLKIKVGEKEISLFEYGRYGFFGVEGSRDLAVATARCLEHSNYESVQDELTRRYVQLETNDLFNKIDEIKEYFDSQE